ncbi:MAG TPA: tetratricopeptide repeat protein [Devosia sp.]
MIRLLAAALITALTLPVLAQTDPAIEDLRPEEMQFPDNLGLEELPIAVAPELPTAKPGEEALSVSNEVLGPRVKVDAAYGAFQRGYYLTALELALPRAEQSDASAQTLIAEIYAKGLGVPENQTSASSWYALAAKNGDPIATFELGLMYQQGRGVPKSRERAAKLFQQAADMGNVAAKYNLGLLHIEGRYAAPDMVKAAALIKEAADAGMVEAMYDYGSMLMEGAGVPPNATLGAEQIGLAAKEGMVAAQVDYATLLYLGEGVAKNIEEAVSWYARAAQAGNPVAQNRYAKLLAAGEGVEPDLEQAAMWRSLARRQGLTDPVLDKLLVSILPEELARAEERARFWPSEPPRAVAQNTGAPTLTPSDTATP